MHYSGNIYLLINALSKGEKRYFRLQAGFNRSNSQLLQIFDAISRKSLADDAALKAFFTDAPFMKQLDVLKVHLYHLILSTMRSFYKTRTLQREIRGMIDDMHFLFEKSLYSQCYKMLQKAKAAATEIGYYAALVDLLDIERMLIGLEKHVLLDENNIHRLRDEEKSVVQALNQEAGYKYFGLMTNYLNKRYGQTRNEAEQQKLEEMIQHPSLHVKQATTLRSKRLLFYSLMAYELTTGNYEAAVKHNQQIIDSYGDNKILIRENPIGLLSAISNQVILFIRLKQYSGATQLIQQLQLLPDLLNKSQRRNKELMMRIQMNVFNYRLGLYLETGAVAEATALEPTVLQFIEEHKNTIHPNRKYELLFSLAYLHFVLQQHDKALAYLLELNKEPIRETRKDMFASVVIIQLLIHYELGNKNLLPYLSRSVYRLLLQSNRLQQFEQILIRFMRHSMPKVTGKTATRKAFSQLKSELTAITSSQFEAPAFIMFDIISWLDSKISGITYAQAIQHEASKHL